MGIEAHRRGLGDLSCGEVYRLNELVRGEGELRGWGSYWQEVGVRTEVWKAARVLAEEGPALWIRVVL